jgi:uncharacterized protein
MPHPLADTLKATAGQMLPAMCGFLTKGQASAAERNIPEEVFLNDRLYPDMFPLVRQVQTATDMIARGTARLTASEFLSLPDVETSFAELIARARKVNDYVQAASAEAIEANADAMLAIPLGPETRQMPGRVYLLNFVFPNFYFHTTMTYAILRHRGVMLGKRDFMTPG